MKRITIEEIKEMKKCHPLYRISDGHLLCYNYVCPHPYMDEMHILANNDKVICVCTAEIRNSYFLLESKEDAKQVLINWHKEAIRFWQGYYDDEIEKN